MHQMLSFGPYSVDISRRVVTKNGAPLRMTLKCIELLIAFVRHPGKALSKEELIEAAWHDPSASDATLAQHIFLLRRALKHDGETFIETVPQVGYRFAAQVSGRIEDTTAIAREYVEGAEAFRSLQTEQGLRSAIDLYTRALAIDERNARAYARRAACSRMLAEYMYAEPFTSLSGAKADAEAALSCDPHDIEARIESAFSAAFFDRDISAARRHVDVAEKVDPKEPWVRAMRVMLPLMRGDAGAALSESRSHGATLMAAALYFSRSYSKALALFESAGSDHPSSRLLAGACRLFMGDVEAAIEIFRALYREHVDVRDAGKPNVRHYALAFYIFAVAKSGDRLRARRAVADLTALARQRYVSPMARAVAHIGLGEMDVAMTFIDEAIARFDPWAAYIALDPFLDSVRDDSRFAQLTNRLAA